MVQYNQRKDEEEQEDESLSIGQIEQVVSCACIGGEKQAGPVKG